MIDLHGIISIAGMPGLFKVVAQSKNGVIVESLADKKRFPAFASHKISSLEDISMFTTGEEDKPLREIMKAIYDKENGGPAIDPKKDDKAIIAYFESVVPDYDKERVYTSNMRKLFTWYNQLQSTGNLKLKEKEEEKEGEEKISLPVEEKNTKTASFTHKGTGKVKQQGAAGIKKTIGVRKTGTA